MDFKVGDKVRIREDLIANKDYGKEEFVPSMEKYKGKIGKIKDKYEIGGYDVLIDNDIESLDWFWSDEMLEPYDETIVDGGVIKFAKVKPNAKIPSKRKEDAGYDVYPLFDGDYIMIEPHTVKMIPTGIASAFSENYVMVLKERGSTGTKGMAIRCSVVDSGFRGEWFVPINNTTNSPIIISKLSIEETTEQIDDLIDEYRHLYGLKPTFYPYEKAICQALLLPVPKVKVEEISYDDLKKIESNRGTGALGSSGK